MCNAKEIRIRREMRAINKAASLLDRKIHGGEESYPIQGIVLCGIYTPKHEELVRMLQEASELQRIGATFLFHESRNLNDYKDFIKRYQNLMTKAFGAVGRM